MRHNKSGRKFGRTAAHRQAMTRNQITSLLRSGRIETTEAKAKELRRWVERVITTAKPDDLHARRQVALYVRGGQTIGVWPISSGAAGTPTRAVLPWPPAGQTAFAELPGGEALAVLFGASRAFFSPTVAERCGTSKPVDELASITVSKSCSVSSTFVASV